MPYPSPSLWPGTTGVYPGFEDITAPPARLRIRERPPLRLMVDIETPAGSHYRWGEDEHDPANVPADLSFSSTMPGGFERLGCTLARREDLAYPDLIEFSTLTAYGPGGQVVWQGRLETTPRTSGQQMAITPGAVGWQAHLDDNASAVEIYVDRDLTRWGDPSLTRQAGLQSSNFQFASGQVAPDPTSGLPAIIQTINDDWAAPAKPTNESWYDAGAGALLASIYYNLTDSQAGVPNWQDFIAFCIDANGTTFSSTGNIIGTGVTGYTTAATPYRFAMLNHLYNATPGGAAGGQYNAYWHDIAVYGDHGLTGVGPDPVGYLASDVVAHAVGKFAPKLATARAGASTIERSAFVIPHLAFITPTTCTDIITQATRFELQDWWVDEGPTFNLASRANHGRTWRARSGEAQLSETGPQVDRIFNSVIVQYQDVAGVPRTVGPPGSGADTEDATLNDPDPLNPASIAGLTRRSLLQMNTSTPAGAVAVGAAFLQEQKLLDTSGQATLTGHVEDASGVLWPAWMPQAGDRIAFTDAADPAYRRIVSASYTHASRANQINLDSPPNGLQALLERLSVSLVGLGFT